MPQAPRRHTQQELLSIEDAERQAATVATAKVRRRGHVSAVADLYPDLRVSASMGYTRQGVPLLPMSLLYEKLVVYVPPTHARGLATRWGLSYPDFLQLVRSDLVQPMIGHVPDYAGAHFRQLFDCEKPVPSVWTRGLTALTQLGLDDSLRPETYAFDFDQLAAQPSMLAKFRQHFPRYSADQLHERIRSELLTNLADLALFGEHDIVEDLQRAAYRLPPDDLARTILLLSEVRAYPTLFGLGGTTNYDGRSTRVPLADELQWAGTDRGIRKISGDGYAALLKGIGFDPATLNVQAVIDFHSSGDGRLLRSAMAAFERDAHRAASKDGVLDLDPMAAEANELDRILREVAMDLQTPERTRRYDNAVRRTSWLLQIGGVALGGFVGLAATGSPVGAAGGAAVFREAVVEPAKAALTNAVVAQRFRPGAANLWRIKRHSRK